MSLRKDLEMILPCINCGVNADPADGFGSCTCGNADRIENIINLIESVVGEIIGEDEKEMVLVESEITVAKEHGYRTKIEKSEWFDEKIHARNKLRKEQRDIKSKLIGGSNGKE